MSGRGQNPGIPGPAGPPGPGFTATLDLSGTNTEQQVVGFRGRPISLDEPVAGQIHVYDGLVWDPGSPGADVLPLSRTLYVDAGTLASAPEQDGSISRPFAEISQAAEVANAAAAETNWHIIAGPGTYGPVVLSGNHRFLIEGSSSEGCVIDGTYFPGIMLQPPTFFDFVETRYRIRNLRVIGNPGMAVDTFNYPFPSVIIIEDSVVEGIESSTNDLILVTGKSSVVYDVAATGQVQVREAAVRGNFFTQSQPVFIEAHVATDSFVSPEPTFRNCTFGASVNLSTPFSLAIYRVDGRSLFNLLENGGTFNTGPDRAVYNPDLPYGIKVAATSNATPEPVALAYVPAGSAATLDVMAVARRGSSQDPSAAYRLIATFKNVGGTLSQVGATTVVLSAEDDPSWDFTLSPNGDFVVANLVGDSSNPVDWTVYTTPTSTPVPP